jgi:hypothetical protein
VSVASRRGVEPLVVGRDAGLETSILVVVEKAMVWCRKALRENDGYVGHAAPVASCILNLLRHRAKSGLNRSPQQIGSAAFAGTRCWWEFTLLPSIVRCDGGTASLLKKRSLVGYVVG